MHFVPITRVSSLHQARSLVQVVCQYKSEKSPVQQFSSTYNVSLTMFASWMAVIESKSILFTDW